MELYRLFVALVALVAADASSMSAYWRQTLPTTPMPTMIKDMTETLDKMDLPKPVVLEYACAPDKVKYEYYTVVDQAAATKFKEKDGQTFFLLKETSQGSTIRMLWLPTPKTGETITFLPRHEAESIPFSSDKLPEIYKRLSVNPVSKTAKIMNVSLKACETKDKDAKDEFCLTSLESMIDFAKSELGGGSDIKAMTSMTKEKGVRSVGMTTFEILEVKKEVEYGAPMVACHIQPYPYAVFYCHRTKNTAAYTVTLVGGGMKVEALAICHGDSSSWNPETLALQVLEVEPGKKDPICHFMEWGNLLWVNK